jgi:hypothetical protein
MYEPIYDENGDEVYGWVPVEVVEAEEPEHPNAVKPHVIKQPRIRTQPQLQLDLRRKVNE